MRQAIRTVQQPIRTSLSIPGSKSITNRGLLLAALANGASELSGIQLSQDTLSFINALKQLGVVVQVDESTRSCIIGGGNGKFPKKEASIWCDDAGTLARFLLAACTLTDGAYMFDGSERLKQRPIKPLLDALQQQGAQYIPDEAQYMPLTLLGTDTIPGGHLTIDGADTSQIVSALLMIAPFARSPMTLTAQHIVSRPYIDLTIKMMAEFGVTVVCHEAQDQTQFTVPVPQFYQARDYFVEPDFSTASYFFAAAAVTGGEITIKGISRAKSKQADALFLSVLEKMGCQVHETHRDITLKAPARLRGLEVDMRDFSDTFITLAVIAPFATTPVRITHIGHVRLKESDRIAAVQSELQKLGIRVESGQDWITIFPGSPQGGIINPHRDHRLAMGFSVLGLRVPHIQIDHAECVNKTCPEFFKLWSQLSETECVNV